MRSHCSLQTPKVPLQANAAFDPVALAVLGSRVGTAYRPASHHHHRNRRRAREWTECESDKQMAGPPRVAFVCCKGTLDRPCCFILTFPGGSLGCRDNAGHEKRKRAKFQNKNIFQRGSWTEGGVIDAAQWLLKLARNGLMAGWPA